MVANKKTKKSSQSLQKKAEWHRFSAIYYVVNID